MTALSLLSAVLSTTHAWADGPLPPPSAHRACSPSEEVCVTSDPEEGTFPHSPQSTDRSPGAWHIPQWFRAFWVLDDGAGLVTGYDGLNLVPLEDPASAVVVSFWRDGALVRSHTLAELGYEKRRLERTASHYRWGGYQGLREDQRFVLEMVDGARLTFDATTGELLERSERPR